jgi:hypothetical protein
MQGGIIPMSLSKINFILMLALFNSAVYAQDSTDKKKTKVIPERRHEVGISILTPFLMLTGANDSHNERFMYAAYRYRLSQYNSIKAAVGFAPFFQEYRNNPVGAISSPQNTVYLNVTPTNPVNYQVCFGYERMFGGRLKHVFGIDLLYNKRVMVENYYYTEIHQQTDPFGNTSTVYKSIDTGAYHKTYRYNRFGFNLTYSLRYEFSKRFVLMASAIGSFKYTVANINNRRITNFDFNTPGLVADVTLFYRFK